ncbi:DNA-binding LacI/PurR family transcriptional regulator [Streptosporangium album]|uniref:DNA-binding LacI/PurR family transcriptional regulator n=1 Tax=Streptosporangium album TaxID=47479 RepID=A0A7W7S183_9ACTN|nr:LacI family DNA-binding transcriptional regulator [Streptosporangium album]MBB4941707.1 DNA-binding LacI/PurR family transcriptional regulator [Streptosporangium album]
MSAKPPTSLDVAREAGVSQATVSYVLNNREDARVSDETRARVKEAANRLGYVPHAGARTLRTGHSRLVLVPLVNIPYGPLAVGLMEELDSELGRLGYTMIQYGARRLKGVAAARAWAELRPVAVLAPAERLTRQAVDVLHSAGIKAVIGIGVAGWPSEIVSTMTMDHEGIGATAAEHILARGSHTLTAIVPAEKGLRDMGLRRAAGVQRVAAAHRVPYNQVDLAFSESATAAWLDAWQAADTTGHARTKHGVFTYNDDYAMLLMAVLADNGISVPGDVAVVGCDDLPLAKLLRPRLTTVRLDVTSAPAMLAQTLDEIVRTGGTGQRLLALWPHALVERDST